MIRILFICHGNICRSVAAQYIFQNLVQLSGRNADFLIDSAATSNDAIGWKIYEPMRHALEENDIPLGNHEARKLTVEDYDAFDLLIGMDDENLYHMQRLFPEDALHKIHLLMEYTNQPDEIIEDPWYTGQYSQCVSQLENGCMALFRHLCQNHSLQP